MNSLEKEILTSCVKYTLTSSEEKHINLSGQFCFPKTFTGFMGHFPGQPILPAVVQLTLVRLLTEKGLDRRLFPSHFERVKFRTTIEPNLQFTAELSIVIGEKEINCKFALEGSANKRISSGHCVYSILNP